MSESGPASGAPAAARWWGDTELTPGVLRAWRIGPFHLWVRASAREWRFWTAASGDTMADELVLGAETPEGDVPQDAVLTRVGLSSRPPVLRLWPALADRDVVVRPDTPVVVPAGVRLELFVTTPVWITARAGAAGPVMVDEPSHRLSDTWFGPNTLEGELAYAIRTSARLELEELPRRAHRAITKVTVVNGARDALPLDKLKVPVGGLRIYASSDEGLWTDNVTLERKLQSERAEASIGSGPEVPGVSAVQIAGPRVTTGPRFSLNAFGRLFGV